jgi:uncharacterized protein (TIGR04222 family)
VRTPTAAFALIVRLRLKAGRSGESARQLDVDEMAYLAGGGPERVAEAAVARLIEAEALRPSRRGAVQATGTVTAQNAVDRAVLNDASRHGLRTVNGSIPTVSHTEAVTSVGKRLTDLGLLVAPETAKSRLRLGVVPLGVVFAVGLFRLVNGLRIGSGRSADPSARDHLGGASGLVALAGLTTHPDLAVRSALL